MTSPPDSQPHEALTPWLGIVDRLLGPVFEDEPLSEQLVAYVGGEPTDDREAVAAMLLREPRLRAAVRAGLDELRRQEGVSEQVSPPGEAPGVLRLFAPPMRAAADSQGPETLLVPEDRAVLGEEEGATLVYYRRASVALVSLFAEGQPTAHAGITCHVGELPLEPDRTEGGVTTFVLGSVRSALGQVLRVEVPLAGGMRSWSWLLEEHEG